MTLFDPGWRGEQTKGPEDWGVADLGNDPMGIIDRCGLSGHLQLCIHETTRVNGMVRLYMLPCAACDITYQGCLLAIPTLASQQHYTCVLDFQRTPVVVYQTDIAFHL